MAAIEGTSVFVKPLANPDANAFGRKLLANSLRLLVCVSLDHAAVRGNGNHSPCPGGRQPC